MTIIPPQEDDRLGLKKKECFACINASWQHSPGHYWYPKFSHCKCGAVCQPKPMSIETRIFVTAIYEKYRKAGRVKE